MGIDTIPGNLSTFARFKPGTFRHWDELSADQIADVHLLDRSFYVADYVQYHKDSGKPSIAFVRHTPEHLNNLVLNHFFDAKNSSYEQLIHMHNWNFHPDPDEARAVLYAGDTLQVRLGDLRLSDECLVGRPMVYRVLAIRTADGFVKVGEKYERPNEAERAVIQRAGYTEAFLNVLGKKPYCTETGVLVLPSGYVASMREPFIGRVAWRGNLYNKARSGAYDVLISNRYYLRGAKVSSKDTQWLKGGKNPRG